MQKIHRSPSSISQINFFNSFSIGFWAALVPGLLLPSAFSATFSFCKNISAVGAGLLLYYYGADVLLDPTFFLYSTSSLFRWTSVWAKTARGLYRNVQLLYVHLFFGRRRILLNLCSALRRSKFVLRTSFVQLLNQVSFGIHISTSAKTDIWFAIRLLHCI